MISANDIKSISVTSDRPGMIQPMMMPTKLTNQVRVGLDKTNLLIKPVGKTPWGGTQWSIQIQRPGGDNTQPLIVARKEQAAMADIGKAIQMGLIIKK